MEKYNDFLNRINYQQAELQIGNGYFNPHGRVYEKVNPDNTFKPFYGDTVVFDLDSRTKAKISKIIDALYEVAHECFCEKLDKGTIHMTLHDLSASDKLENTEFSRVFAILLQKIRPHPYFAKNREGMRSKNKKKNYNEYQKREVLFSGLWGVYHLANSKGRF